MFAKLLCASKRKGFTLVELLVVIAIIGILSAIVLSSISTARQKAQIAKAQGEVRSIRTAVTMLELDTGQWPNHQTVGSIASGASGNEVWDLNAQTSGLVATDGSFPGWKGPYMTSVPPDPWGNPYFFDTDYDVDPTAGQTWAAVVGSFGPNGDGQNVYDSDNIYDTIISQ